MAQLQSLSIKGVDIIDYIYPVGIYISFKTSIDPNTHFEGTTWERVYDAFLYSVPQGQTANVTGGEKTHTLTVDELPQNIGTLQAVSWITESDTGAFTRVQNYADRTANPGTDMGTTTHTLSGGGAAHNNMPPYEGCYTWHRTA